jgi:hypothetical protein
MQYSQFSGPVAKAVSLWESTRVLPNSAESTSVCSASVPARMQGSSAADPGGLLGGRSMPSSHNPNVCGGLPLRSAIVATASSR